MQPKLIAHDFTRFPGCLMTGLLIDQLQRDRLAWRDLDAAGRESHIYAAIEKLMGPTDLTLATSDSDKQELMSILHKNSPRWLRQPMTANVIFQVKTFTLFLMPSVHAPVEEDSRAILRALETTDLPPQARVLVVGPGTGVDALAAAYRGAIVTTYDVNPWAVANTLFNAHWHGYGDRVYAFRKDVARDDLVQIPHDAIIWNAPGLTQPSQMEISHFVEEDPALVMLYDEMTRAIRNLRPLLKPGCPLIIRSHIMDQEFYKNIGAANGLSLSIAWAPEFGRRDVYSWTKRRRIPSFVFKLTA